MSREKQGWFSGFGIGFLGVDWGREFVASWVVFLVALPLCMGIAMASQVPIALGLWTGIVGGIVVGLLAGSPLQVSGPAAGLIVLILQIVKSHPQAEALRILAVIVFLGGILQMLAGILRLGQWFRAVSPAVIHGMLAGIGVLIFSSQFHVMIDERSKDSGWKNLLAIPVSVLKAGESFFAGGNSTHHLAAGIGVFTILTVVLWNHFRPKALRLLPGPLLGIVLATCVCAVSTPAIKYVKFSESLIGSINWLDLSALWRLIWCVDIWVSACVIAFIASAETLLCASAVDQMHQGVRTKYDKELFAQGVGNILCGVLGALPMTGVIVRSSANVDAGAKTRFSSIFHGVWLLLAVVFFASWLNAIPKAALA
ncbi:MAG: SulP family inorganic anion transporter, partial [Myxococcota bacterium]